jgi:hypothetical protein
MTQSVDEQKIRSRFKDKFLNTLFRSANVTDKMIEAENVLHMVVDGVGDQ